ncbi:MAG: winged helix-turn-helix transcriptional regulator [Ferruginibacter sp.]|nr:winged helix-turn-helix transcriptional regulator [Ferruginibacter sp.]
MGAIKTDHFADRQNNTATLAKALTHPARIVNIDFLLSVDSCICRVIGNILPIAQPGVSRHLKELKNAGLVKGNIDGKSTCYCIDEKVLAKFQPDFTSIATKIGKERNRCCYPMKKNNHKII